jgi:hypothetical protein
VVVGCVRPTMIERLVEAVEALGEGAELVP